MNQPRPKIRVGLLLGSVEVAAWVARMLEWIQASDYAQIVLLVVDQSPPTAAAPLLTRLRQAPAETLARIVRRLLEKFDQHFTEAKSNLPSAFKRVNAQALLAGIARVDVVPTRTLWSDRMSDAEIKAIAAHDVDVLLRIGFRILRGGILTVARHGVWSFHHGDNQINRGGPPGFWEAMEEWPQTGCTLQVLSEDLDNGVVLGRTWSATIPESLAENLDSTYWKSLSLVPRQLELLHRKGASTFFAEARAAEPHPHFYSRRLYRAANNAEFARLLARRIWKKVRLRVRRQFWFDQWILLFHMNDGFSSSLWRYQRVLPPKDRFWADPFVVQRGERYYVFIEELPYATNKGHISVIEVDAKGKPGPAIPVLVTDHHLSYPFVFEHEGQTYMVPESRSDNCVPLYRCIEFPLRWEKVMNLMEGVAVVDATLHFQNGRWWLFANRVENRGGSSCDELYVFHAPTFATQDWTPHPLNPVVSDVRRARPAGRLFERDGRLYRPSQDCSHRYGWGLNLNVVEQLDEQNYSERVVTKAEPDWAPDVVATHTYSSAGRLNVVDAQIRRRR